jgi:anti-sigma factor (TIGR02949 family)
MDQIDQITCAELIHGLPSFLDDEVAAVEREAFAAHLDRCAHCLATYRFERKVLATVKRKLRTGAVPGDLARRIGALIAAFEPDDGR